MLPFTHAQFLDVFRDYNLAIWPVHVVALVLGLAAVALTFARSAAAGRIVSAILALMWLWNGVVYHGMFFTGINKAAWLFACLFVFEGLLLTEASYAGRLSFRPKAHAARRVGLGLALYALVLYPLIGRAFGLTWPTAPVFGTAPCPVTIFTFGLLLMAEPGVPRRLLIVPALWAAVGGSAAFLLAVPQDWMLLASGLIAVPWLLATHHNGKGP